MKKLIFFLTVLSLLQTAKSQVVFFCDFENVNSRNWSEVCRSWISELWIGTAESHGGQYSMYISSDQGATINYSHGYPGRATLMGKTVTLDTGYYLLSADCNVYGFYQFNTFCAALSILLLPDTASNCTFNEYTGGYYVRPSYAIMPNGLQYISATDGWQIQEAPFRILDSGDYKLVVLWESSGSINSIVPPNDQHMAVDNISIEKIEMMPAYLAISTNNANLGTTTGGGWYFPGDTATLMALPIGGNVFVGWSDNEIANPRQIAVDADSTIIAIYAPLDTSGIITVYLPDTIQFYIDTITYVDTLSVVDTLLIYDTLNVYDTVTVQIFDTIPIYDTVTVFDTVTIYDTVQVSIENVDITALPWTINVEDKYISVCGAEGETIRIFDALGRQLHIQPATSAAVRFRMPSSGVYLIKVGSSPARKVTIIR